MAYETGYYVRKPDKIRAFEFAVVCALAAVVEMKRGFAPVWRLLMAVANIVTARSAVTQRFGPGSANLLEALFERAVKKLPSAGASVLRPKLNQFHEVLAQDGTVLQLSPVLAKLFPATRTNTVDAAAKAHVTADVVARRIVDVTVTGERDSELRELYRQDFAENALYLLDLGYTSYDLFSLIVHSKAFLLMRLKENANPTVVNVRHGVKAPKRSIGKKFQELKFCKTHDSFDLDAEFYCWEFDEKVTMRVVGQWNPDTERYHCYVTNLPPEDWTVEELATLYRRVWITLGASIPPDGAHGFSATSRGREIAFDPACRICHLRGSSPQFQSFQPLERRFWSSSGTFTFLLRARSRPVPSAMDH